MEGLLYRESIKFAKNILDGVNPSEILEEIRQYTSTNYRANQIFSTMTERMKNISLDLIEVIAENKLDSRLAILISIMKTDHKIYNLIHNLFLNVKLYSNKTLTDKEISQQLIMLGMDVKLPKIKLIFAESGLITLNTMETSIMCFDSIYKLFQILCKEEWKQ